MTLIKDLPDAPGDIIAYLRDHPDFFVTYADILSELKIPHDIAGNVASLIEYQVAQLRHENSGLNESLKRAEQDISRQRVLANAIHD